MEQAARDPITDRLAELAVAHRQLRSMIEIMARAALSGTPLSTWEAAALADSMISMIGAADGLLDEARAAHEGAAAQARLPLVAPRLRVVAGLVRSVAGEAS